MRVNKYINNGIVIIENKVVINIPPEANLWSPSNFSANNTACAAEGIATKSTLIWVIIGSKLKRDKINKVNKGYTINLKDDTKINLLSKNKVLKLTSTRELPMINIEIGKVMSPNISNELAINNGSL